MGSINGGHSFHSWKPWALTFATTLGFAVTTPVAEAANACLRLHVLCHSIWRDHRPANSLQMNAIKNETRTNFHY
jgi:hypothetical protein